MPSQKQEDDEEIKNLTQKLIKNLNFSDKIHLTDDNLDIISETSEYKLENIDGLEEELEKLLVDFNINEKDPAILAELLTRLISKYISSTKTKLTEKDIKALIAKEVQKMSQLILDEYGRYLENYTPDITPHDQKQKKEEGQNFARDQLKRLIKTFAVYEIYKVMSPRRIAGETKLDNFIHNVMSHHDVKYATRFTGGKKSDIARYSINIKNTLRKENIRNKNLLGR